MEIANRVVDATTDTISLIARMPGVGVKRDRIELGLRGFPVGNYIVYYREEHRHVFVARVLHAMRDQELALYEH